MKYTQIKTKDKVKCHVSVSAVRLLTDVSGQSPAADASICPRSSKEPREGELSTSSALSFRLAVLPAEQQAPFPAIYMLTSSASIPY